MLFHASAYFGHQEALPQLCVTVLMGLLSPLS